MSGCHAGYTRTMHVIEDAFAPLGDKIILDCGSGTGLLLRALTRRTARPIGIDPNMRSLEISRQNCPDAPVIQASAEMLPFGDSCLDGTIFLNSLHHVHKSGMAPSLKEAVRCTRTGGILLVLEPLCHGGYFEVLRPIHDETDVRSDAQSILDDFVTSGLVVELQRFAFDTRERVSNAESIISGSIQVDGDRAHAASLHRSEVHDLFDRHAYEHNGHLVLDQPMMAVIMLIRS